MFEKKSFWGVDTLVAVGTKMLNPPVKGGCWFTFNDKMRINRLLTVGCCKRQQLTYSMLHCQWHYKALPRLITSAVPDKVKPPAFNNKGSH